MAFEQVGDGFDFVPALEAEQGESTLAVRRGRALAVAFYRENCRSRSCCLAQCARYVETFWRHTQKMSFFGILETSSTTLNRASLINSAFRLCP